MLKALFIFLFIVFGIYTIWICLEFGDLSVPIESFKQHPTTQVYLDLSLCCLILGIIMLKDHLQKGRSLIRFIPYVVLPITLGVFGPLLYFIINPIKVVGNHQVDS